MAKVLMTSADIEVTAEQLAVFDGLGVEFEARSFASEDELVEGVRDVDGLVVVADRITARVVAAMDRCKIIARMGVGVDGVDLAAARAAGITVTNVPDANYLEVAAHAMAMAMAIGRRLPAFDRAVRAGRFDAMGTGAGIRRADAQVFGLVGFGRIGRRVATMAAAVGYDVWAYDPVVADPVMSAAGVTRRTFDELLRGADIVSLHVPLVDTTRNIIGAVQLAKMKPTAILLNVSRGGLVDETALADALRSGTLAGAGLDVFSSEPDVSPSLLELDTVLLSPHAAHYSRESILETTHKAFEEVARALRGERARSQVA